MTGGTARSALALCSWRILDTRVPIRLLPGLKFHVPATGVLEYAVVGYTHPYRLYCRACRAREPTACCEAYRSQHIAVTSCPLWGITSRALRARCQLAVQSPDWCWNIGTIAVAQSLRPWPRLALPLQFTLICKRNTSTELKQRARLGGRALRLRASRVHMYRAKVSSDSPRR